jgi:hypothetical protein
MERSVELAQKITTQLFSWAGARHEKPQEHRPEAERLLKSIQLY